MGTGGTSGPAARVLITGGAGFLGSALVRRLLDEDAHARVLTFDLLTYAGRRENLDGLSDPARHALVRGDVTDPEAVERAFDGFRPTGVLHLAAETHVDRSLEDAAPFVRTNVLGTGVVLEAARRSAARLVHVSTDEVYGDIPAPARATPSSPLAPSNPYAATKAAADLLVLAAARRGQDALVTRGTNTYGPRQVPEKLVPLATLRALAGLRIPVYGDGLQVRQWIHADDHAAGILAAMRLGRAGEVHHLAGEEGRTNLDVVRAILEAVGADPGLAALVRDRPAHDRRYALDDAASRRSLAWAPRVGFAEGLAATVAWYREHGAACARAGGEDLAAFLARNYEGR